MNAGNVIMIDARKGSDFTLDAIWAGLVNRFGWNRVYDWPPADKHRDGIPTITGDVDKDYGNERKSMCYTPDHDKFPRLSLEKINEMISNGDVMQIFVDEREESYRYYLQTVARFHRVPVVVISGHDRFWNTSPKILFDYYGRNLKALFVDNWRDEYDQYANAFLMNYSTNFDHLWKHELRQEYLKNKVYDICFMGYNSHGDRARIVDHLIQKYGADGNCLFVEKRPNTVESFLPKSKYFADMAQSRICINLKGAAECGKALRFYEIPYVGSYMLSQRFPGVQVKPYIGGIHCDYFSSVEDMDETISYMLRNPAEREVIAAAGHKHAMTFHTSDARVDYIYKTLDENNLL